MSRQALLEWIAGLGAASAEAVASRECTSVRSARSRLVAAERAGLLASHRPLSAQPALYTLTPAGMRAVGWGGTSPSRVSNTNAPHLLATARAAAALERCYPDHRVMGERALRRAERLSGAPLASARLEGGPDRSVLHRPDLVLWPLEARGELPVAFEVELAVKAPQRLIRICRAWGRCRGVGGVVYLAAPDAERALARAVELVRASDRVLVLPLGALPGLGDAGR
jgi:hypothetical protein